MDGGRKETGQSTHDGSSKYDIFVLPLTPYLDFRKPGIMGTFRWQDSLPASWPGASWIGTTLKSAACGLCLVASSIAAYPAESADDDDISGGGATGDLIVELTDIASDEGSVIFAMWSGPEGWLGEDPLREGSVNIVAGQSSIRFDGLPYGEYAISVYHDRNGNQKLDTGLFRIPKEPIGTSNDAKIRFGPPKYEDARFLVDQPSLTIKIPVKKLF